MAPLSHIYISTNITGQHSPLLILGSILPDISSTSAQQFGRDQIHNAPKMFNDFITQNYPHLADLGLGVRLHSQVDGGADFFSDDLEEGYAKIEGAKISDDVTSLLGIPEGDISLVLAHNFIEAAVDFHIYQNHRKIWDIYNEGIQEVSPEIPQIAKCMADYLNLQEQMITDEIHNLIGLLHPNNSTSKDLVVDKTALHIIKNRSHKDVSRDKTMQIMDKALAITAPTYMAFLDNALIQVKRNVLGI